jgi:ArsR family transcriptional regulator
MVGSFSSTFPIQSRLVDESTIVNQCASLEGMPAPQPSPLAELATCCNPVTGGVLDPAAAERLARIFKALSDPTRVRLVSLVVARGEAEACVCELTDPVGVSQPTVSHHLKQLVEAGILTRSERGRWSYYRLATGALDTLAGTLAALTHPTPPSTPRR